MRHAKTPAPGAGGIHLINPPFGTPTDPYISIPVLASYLDSRGIAVSAFDAAKELVVRLVTPRNLRKGRASVIARFRELNHKSELAFAEMYEYIRWVSLLDEAGRQNRELEWLSMPFADFTDVQKSRGRLVALRLAAGRFFPEVLFNFRALFSMGIYSPFSSSDLLKSVDDRSLFSDLMRDLAHQAMRERSPLIVGFSVIYSNQVIPAFQMAYHIKRLYPQVHLTMGGPFITIHLRQVKEKKIFSIIDSLILEEGEIPLEALLEVMSSGSADFQKVPGLVYCEGDEIHVNPSAPPVEMEKVPPPDYTIFDLNGYLNPPSEIEAPFQLSKGCYWQRCSFCRTNLYATKHYQQPAAEVIYRNLKQVMDQTGLGKFVFSDESAHPEILEYICRRMLADGIRIQWRAHTRVDRLLTRDRCRLYREAGCSMLSLGIESLDDRTLRSMRKGISVKLIEEVLEEIGGVLPIGAFMIVGFPGETQEEFLQSVRTIEAYQQKGLVSLVTYSLYSIYCDSHVWSHPEKYGITEMHTYPDDDLSPDVIDFSSKGVSRDTVFQVYNRVNMLKKQADRDIDGIEEILVSGERERVNFNLKQIAEIQANQCNFRFSSLQQWFEHGNRTIPPLKPNNSKRTGDVL
jgi:radical SAM superfamily enzyme YgiQ (UPF0313 family)